MAQFRKSDSGYTISGDAGQTLNLTAEDAYGLLCQLYEHSDELWNAFHPHLDQAAITREFVATPSKAWYPETHPAPEDYKPQDGDVYIQEIRAGRYNAHRHNGAWVYITNMSEQDALDLIYPMHYMGESKGKRQYYRPTGQEQEEN